MKKITLLLSFIACVMVAQGQLLVNENFNYTTGTGLIGQGSWVITGTSVVNPITITTSTITYTGYPSSGIGSEITLANNGQDVNKPFTNQTAGTVYVSTLVNISAAQTGDYFLHVGETSSASNFFCRTFVKLDGTKIAFGILNASTPSPGTATPTYTASTFDLNTTYLLVLKINVVTGESSLIVNPELASEPSSNWISSTNGTNVPAAIGIGTICIRQGSSTSAATLKLDGIRVATSWANLFTATGIKTLSANNLEVSLVGKKLTVTNSPSSSVEIFSAVGSKIQTIELLNGSANLNLSKGLYIVRAGKKAAKIMIQ